MSSTPETLSYVSMTMEQPSLHQLFLRVASQDSEANHPPVQGGGVAQVNPLNLQQLLQDTIRMAEILVDADELL
jgi:hypothetical protein